MTPTKTGQGAELLGRTLHEITQLLESADAAEERVQGVLERLRKLVPYQQCAILEARLGYEPRVVVPPSTSDEERVSLTASLLDLFGQLVGREPRPLPAAKPAGTALLGAPLVGLDEVIGLLLVRSSEADYQEQHLRVLSLVAAQLAAYFTMLHGRAELAELARERDEARRVAEAANRAKDEFLALVSHELKSPLSSILAGAHSLRTTADEAERARMIDDIERNVQTETRLIDGILELASIASAELRLKMCTTEPASLIKATIDGLRLAAERKSIRIESHLDTAAMPLLLDPDRISQVVSILLSNAIRFARPGGQVQISLQRTLGSARIQVSDEGSGISREALPHVFDRFPADNRLDVGLAVVKELVELHGGNVRAESAGLELGATFTVELPHVSRAVDALRLLAANERGEPRPLTGIRVLLVDHDLGLRESFQAVLEEYGAEVAAVASAAEALAALEHSRPDVLLFGDLALPGESVYDVMREVTVRTSSLPAASISAWRTDEFERQVGFRLHLVKPIEIQALVGVVADLAGRTRPADRLVALDRGIKKGD